MKKLITPKRLLELGFIKDNYGVYEKIQGDRSFSGAIIDLWVKRCRVNNEWVWDISVGKSFGNTQNIAFIKYIHQLKKLMSKHTTTVLTSVEQFKKLKKKTYVFSATKDGPRSFIYAGISPDDFVMLRVDHAAEEIVTVTPYKFKDGRAKFYLDYKTSCKAAIALAEENLKHLKEIYPFTI